VWGWIGTNRTEGKDRGVEGRNRGRPRQSAVVPLAEKIRSGRLEGDDCGAQ
jgi:hypothetical protein